MTDFETQVLVTIEGLRKDIQGLSGLFKEFKENTCQEIKDIKNDIDDYKAFKNQLIGQVAIIAICASVLYSFVQPIIVKAFHIP